MFNSDLADAVAAITHGMPACAARFFTPTAAFWQQMERFKKSIVVEFGCGRGDTMVEAGERGFRWGGCDLRVSMEGSLERGIQRIDAQRHPLDPMMTIIACRPDHSGWVEYALQRAVEHGCVAIYVGLQRNVEHDLGDWVLEAIDFIPDVGEEGEGMWIFEP